MFQNPSQHWSGEYRRKQCVRSVYPAITLLIDKANLAGWSREEVLVAIADAADQQLADATGTTMTTVGGNAESPVENCDGIRHMRMGFHADAAFLPR